ncbi:serine/threonine-protein kinase [Metabacillus crassostreae]|uniref:serine/threonine protein kinase n=1 Tax=Metabacillus crassostreae TaxID=929098 RepID=UPI0019598DFA|nr:protein kinase [Metabacillus crassostreae]MBM7602126.1 serine/threonine-protein kinase [Metabacillus crassostreae]
MKKLYLKLIELFEKPLKTSAVVGGKYTILQLLGKGSYGFTYLVKDERAVIKVLKQLRKYKRIEESGRNSFLLEAKALRDLSYTAFPTLLDQFEDKGKLFIVMEYMHGKTYEELIFIEGQKFTEKEAFKELSEILQLVQKIHLKGYVHRDLRIPNILKAENNVFIIDFGLAKRINESSEVQEEVFKNEEKRLFREISYKSDLYALGHFMLFLLYSSYEPDSHQLRSWEEELPITDGTKRVIRKMLQLDAPYHHVNELINDLDNNLFK